MNGVASPSIPLSASLSLALSLLHAFPRRPLLALSPLSRFVAPRPAASGRQSSGSQGSAPCATTTLVSSLVSG